MMAVVMVVAIFVFFVKVVRAGCGGDGGHHLLFVVVVEVAVAIIVDKIFSKMSCTLGRFWDRGSHSEKKQQNIVIS